MDCFVFVTGVQQDLHYVHQLDIQDRSWTSFFVALQLTSGWASLMHYYHIIICDAPVLLCNTPCGNICCPVLIVAMYHRYQYQRYHSLQKS